MDKFSLEKLEFPKIKEMLKDCCETQLGAAHAWSLVPSESPEEILRGQDETTEAVYVLRVEPDFSFQNVHDLRPLLRKALIGGILEPQELLRCRETLLAAARIKKNILQIKKELPYLQERASGLSECRPLQERIDACLLPEGEVADTASPALARLRQQIRNLEARIRSRLEEFLVKPEWARFLQEPLYTLRGGRYVLPVKQEYRNQFPGIVHDQSASGATVFMEPFTLVEVTNELAAVRAAAQEEELRILEELTELVAAYHQEIERNLQLLGELDFIFAKGRLSNKLKARPAEFTREGYLVLQGARHPLLKGRVVPLNIHLGKDFECLVITGPNTGGKTVALKTVGLLVAMAHAGLHVPVAEGSVFPFLRNVFADIGDEQSIEQSLSTFSGHMKNIITFLQKVDRKSLVLLDELGAGTDPEEGAALGMAILDYLLEKGALVIATTHYSELKVFAHHRERAENACVEFDSRTLRPTYRLSIGFPGQSNAFEIALRLGLFPEIVEKARSFLKPEQRELTELIRHLKEDQAAASEARAQAERLQAEVEQLRDHIRREEERIGEQKRKILEEATWEAQEIIRTARRQVENLLRSLRQQQRELEIKERIRVAEEARKKLKDLAETIEDKALTLMPASQGETCHTLKPGDLVEIPSLNQRGCIVEGPGPDGEVIVQVGAFKLNLPVSELRLVSELQKSRPSSVKSPALQQKVTVPPELDFRGLTVEEALEKIDKYLDSAYLAGLTRVSLIHGKGTGALRDAVRKYLDRHPFVASYRSGNYYEGGTGVTIVEFK
ncbi:MAG: MutS2 protein [Thermoanaerobacterales bacterium 50_218]|nr:MAG: MutS2 protein [Thermoanaerobacterales bacterium 50_218]